MPDRGSRWPGKLSQLGLYDGELAKLQPAEGVTAYDVNTPLFVDYAVGYRAAKLPAGTTAAYHDTGVFDFPNGTILAKTLAYPHDLGAPDGPRRLLETRVLLRDGDRWIPLPYVWNEDQTDATLRLVGGSRDVEWLHFDGESRRRRHAIPNANDCKRCHRNETTNPLGISARQLNRESVYPHGAENQLAYWSRAGILQGAPAAEEAPRLPDWDDETTGSIDERARAWLEANCAHCHNPKGPARNSGLYLSSDVRQPYKFGVYKTPVAAGRGSGGFAYDIVPAEPDRSILIFRLASTEPGVLMPEYGRSLVHEESLALLRNWIEAMEPRRERPAAEMMADTATLSPEQIVQMAKEVGQNGNPVDGEDIFRRRELNCMTCHAVGGVGGRVGPDLAKLPADSTVEYLIESVLLPNKKIKEGFESVSVLTDAGQMFTGILVREESDALVLRDHTRGDFRIPLDEIDERAAAGSLMPTNVVGNLTRAEFLDLIGFLSRLGNSAPVEVAAPGVVRAWQTLDPVPSDIAEAASSLEPRSFGEREDLVWESVYSRVSGELPLGALPHAEGSDCRFVRFNLVAAVDCTVRLIFDSAAGLIVWVGDRRVPTDGESAVELRRGETFVTVLVDLAGHEAPFLRCQIVPKDASSADVRVVDAS